MAFTSDQRASIRKYMGMSRLFKNSNPILESAMDAIDQLNDGGATAAQMVTTLTQLASIETQISVAQQLTLASEVTGEIKIDAGRQLAILRKEGQALINGISIPLSMRPFQKYFYPQSVDESMDIHMHGEGNSWNYRG